MATGVEAERESETARSRPSIRHISALDGARGAAVAGVLLFHGGHLLGGYLGVDLFFTLSGFLITSLLLAESAHSGNVGLGGFWARRARRLLPALAVLMVGIALYCFFVAIPRDLTQIRGDAFATLGYVANWRQVFAHQNYFAIFNAPSPLQHTWSLAIEEQFYLVWPLVFVALLARFKRNTPRAVLVTTLVLAAISASLMIALYNPNNTARLYYGTDTRAAAILLGAALAAWLAIHGPTQDRRRRLALEVLGLVGVVVLFIAWTRLDGQSATLYRGGFFVCGLTATAIIATIVHPDPALISRALSWKPLCALGLISYAVYLYHWPLDIFLDAKRVGLTGWPLFGVQTAVAVGAAVASYKWVEQPIRHGALSAAQWRKFVPALAVGLVAVIFAATLGAKPQPTTSQFLRHPLLAAAHALQIAPPGSQRVLIVGNSVANLLAPGFRSITTHPALSVLDASIPGCSFPPALTGVTLRAPNGTVVKQPPCEPVWEPGVVKRFRPNIVFWLVSDPSGVGGTYRGAKVRPCDPAFDTLYRDSLTAEIKKLGAQGATVVVPTEAYNRYPGAANSDPATDCENRIRHTVAKATGAQLIDLFAHICPAGRCRVTEGGVLLRPDGLHYSGLGGRIVAKWLIDQVKPFAHGN